MKNRLSRRQNQTADGDDDNKVDSSTTIASEQTTIAGYIQVGTLLFIAGFAFTRVGNFGLRETIIACCSALSLATILIGLDKRSNVQRLVLFGTLITLAVLIRLTYWNGIYGHDDFVYLNFARRAFHGILSNREFLSDQWGLRFAVWIPVTVCYKLIGPSYVAAFLPTFAHSITELILIAVFCHFVFRDFRVVAVGLFLAAHYPLSTFTASTLRGDMESSVATGLLLVAVAALLRIDFERYKTRLFVAFGIGFLALAGLWAKPTNISGVMGLILCLPLFIWEKRLRWHELFVLAIGAGCWFLIEAAMFTNSGLSPWNRVENGLLVFQRQYESGAFKGDPSTTWNYPFALLLDIPVFYRSIQDWHVNQYIRAGAWGWLLLFGIIFAIRKTKGVWRFLPVWTIVSLVFFMFGSISLHHYVLIHKEPRYLMFLTVPWMALASFFLAESLKQRDLRRLCAIVVCFALVVSSLSTLKMNYEMYAKQLADIDLVEAEVRAHPETTYFAPHYVVQHLELKTHFMRPATEHRFPGTGGSLSDIAFFHQDQHRGVTVILTRPLEESVAIWEELKVANNRGRLESLHCIGQGRCHYWLYNVE